jgi:CBS domain-containing protein
LTRGKSSTLDAPLSKLFPNLFGVSRPITTPDIPVIVAASILATYESPILPITKDGAPQGAEKQGVKLFKAVGGQQVIRLVVESKPSDYYKVLWGSCTTTSMWLGALEYHESLERLLRIFELTGFGDARVNAPAPPHALVTLDEVVSLYRERKLKCNLEVKEIASRALVVDPDTPLIEAMRLMCEKRVRRLFLRGKDSEFVSDRKILAFLFSPKALTVAKNAPESWTDAKVSEIQPTVARPVSPHAMVEDVGRMVETGRDVFVLSDGTSLVSRWDLVMKPWKAGQLGLS